MKASSVDAGLLAWRIGVFLSLFAIHGYEKIFTFSQMNAAPFPDPLHIGKTASLIFAMISDGICSLLIVVGLATRIAALYSFTTIFIAWRIMHFPYGMHQDHGEVMWLYLASLIAVFIGGPGRCSLDYLLLHRVVWEKRSMS